MDREEIKLQLEDVMSPKRFIHSLNVMNVAIKLAQKFGCDVEKAAIGGLLHDCAKDISHEETFSLCETYSVPIDAIMQNQPELLHGYVGSIIAKERYGILDKEILQSIRYHTTGHENMSMLDKIVFMADYIEPNRSFIGMDDLRTMAYSDMDKALLFAFEKTIKHVIAKKALLHIDTINARNSIVLRINNRNNKKAN